MRKYDVISKNNRMTSLMSSLIRAIRQISKGNEYVYQLMTQLPEHIKQCYWVTRANWLDVPKDYERMHYDHFGAEHLLMGSDTPYGKQSLELTVEQISKRGIIKEDLDKILGMNLAKLLKLVK